MSRNPLFIKGNFISEIINLGPNEKIGVAILYSSRVIFSVLYRGNINMQRVIVAILYSSRVIFSEDYSIIIGIVVWVAILYSSRVIFSE